MVALLGWNFDLPNVIDEINNGTFTPAQQNEIDSHISNLQTYFDIHTTISVVGTTLALTMLCLTLSRVWEIKHGVNQGGVYNSKVSKKLPKNVTQVLIFNIFTVFAASCALLTYTGLIDGYNALGCDLMWKLNVSFYIVSMHMSYWILIGRARAVLDTAFFSEELKTKKLLWFVRKATFMFYLAYPVPLVMMGHVSLPPNMCIYYSSPLMVIFVLVTDSVFSSLLLALFLLPMVAVRNMVSGSGKGEDTASDSETGTTGTFGNDSYMINENGRQIKRTVRRQLRLSLFALSSTLGVTIFLTVVNPLSGDPTLENLGSQYWRVIGGCLFILDCIMQSISIHLITNAWQPSWFVRMLYCRSKKQAGASQLTQREFNTTDEFSYMKSGEDNTGY